MNQMAKQQKAEQGGTHMDNTGLDDVKHQQDQSAIAIHNEHSLKYREAFRIYRNACLWCLFFCLSALMWGYDQQIAGGLLSAPAFRLDFGYVYHGAAVLPAQWQSAFNAVSQVGGVIGCLAFGWIADKVGRRLALAIASVVSIGGVFLQFFATANGVLLAGKLINGIAIGAYLTLGPLYCAEVSPVLLRGITTTALEVAIASGRILGSGIIKACGTRTDKYAYRIPFGVQWIFPVVILCGVSLCPESPWWLVRNKKVDKARRALARLSSQEPTITLANIVETVRLETELEQMHKTRGYIDCFKGTDRRRSYIAIGTFAVQQATGVSFVLGYSSYFFQIAGVSVSDSFSLGLGVSCIGLVGNMCSWFLVNSAGRRPSYLVGTAFLTVIVLVIGILDVVPNKNNSNIWGQAVLCVVFNFIYASYVVSFCTLANGIAPLDRSHLYLQQKSHLPNFARKQWRSEF